MRWRPLRMVVLALSMAAFGLAGGGLAGAASAHDELISTAPGDGSTVTALPESVVLTFDRPALALGTALRIKGPGGDVTEGKPELVDATVRQAIQPGGPSGAYTVQWRVTSADGHPISGQFRFTVTAAGGTAAAVTPAPSSGSEQTTPAASPAASAGATGSAGAAADGAESSSGSAVSPVAWILGAIVLVLVLLAGAVLIVRTRRPGSPPS